jgi:hypothetical protein
MADTAVCCLMKGDLCLGLTEPPRRLGLLLSCPLIRIL